MPGVPFIALTATATRDTRVAIFDAMLMNEPCLIMESPNKENIAYTGCIKKKVIELQRATIRELLGV